MANDDTAAPENKLPGFGLPRRDGFQRQGILGWDKLPDGTLRFPFLLNSQGQADGWKTKGTTHRQIRMLRFVNEITDKPDWPRKVFDEGIVAKWRAEAGVDDDEDDKAMEGGEGGVEKGEDKKEDREGDKGGGEGETDDENYGYDDEGDDDDDDDDDDNEGFDEDVYMTRPMFDYCIAELRDKAKTFENTGIVSVFDAELVILKSETAVPADVRDELRRCVAVLEDVPAAHKDWHPGSGQQVLDLLHPSLFPVVFGRTRVLSRGRVPLDNCVAYTGRGVATRLDDAELGQDACEFNQRHGLDKFQWLPAEVTLQREPGTAATTGPVTASITSYINNLHPRTHRALYAVLARCVAAAVPLWEMCLSGFGDRRAITFSMTDDEEDYYLPAGLRYPFVPRPPSPGGGDRGYHGDGQGDADSTGEPGSDEDDDYKYEDPYQDWWQEHRILRFPEPKPYPPWGAGNAPPKSPLGDVSLTDAAAFPDGVQVIFKLANIHLTPDRPKYAGGAWHIEGTLAERICASALYYYDEDNIGESALHFRTCLDNEDIMMIPAQGAFASLESYMHVRNEQPAVQNLGAVRTRPGRLLVFPNVVQHRVAPFGLDDPSRPGHRKILALFLVDPRRRILSSAHVPPQRRDWWASQVAHQVPALARLPPELFVQTVAAVDEFPVSWEMARADREELMAARRAGADEVNVAVEDNIFSFCEH